jgi:hypothetical protein
VEAGYSGEGEGQKEVQGWGWRADWFEERVHEWTQVIESFKVALFDERILVV